MFEKSIGDGDPESILECGKALLVLDPDIRTYRKIKDAFHGEDLHQTIVHFDIPEELRAEIYAEELDWMGLVKLIQRTSSLPILIQHCTPLLEHSEETVDLIEDTMLAYLLQTGGSTAITQINRLFDTLKLLNRRELISRISQRITDEFPGRFEDVLKPGRKVRGYPQDLMDSNVDSLYLRGPDEEHDKGPDL
jgi:hypothetical protein